MKHLFLLSIIILSFHLQSQNSCSNPLPFCSGTTYSDSTYYANNNSSGPGPNFGCIVSSPRVCYFYGQATQSGNITLQATGTSDIDLIVWGGVNSPGFFCNQQPNQIQDCRYSTNSTESASFTAIYGQYYLIAVTCPTLSTVQFTISQTAGSGALCINACSKPVVAPTLCYVTSNANLNNEIFFNSITNSFKKGTVIYRENSMSLWDSIGYVASGQPDKFIDLTSNTNQQAYRYAIAHLDSCNNIQPKSNIHKTILLQSSLGTGTQVNLSWNLYQGITATSYYIFRGPNSSNMQLINTVSGSTTAYTDINPPAGLNIYKVAITTPTNCTSSATALDTIISSNQRSSPAVGILENESNYILDIYPNPTDNEIHIQTKNIANRISIIDITGKEVLFIIPKNTNEKLNLEGFANGLYFVRVKSESGLLYKKIIVN
jgi:hypothetical protein